MEKLPEKTVILMRHAKSDWGAGLADIDRPLNARGERDAKNMAVYLNATLSGPVQIITSSARRARDTAAALVRAIPRAEIIVQESLYLAGVPTLYKFIEGGAVLSGCQILVAHNPGLEELVLRLDPQAAARIGARKLFPTGAIHAFAMRYQDKSNAGNNAATNVQEFRHLFHQRPKALQ